MDEKWKKLLIDSLAERMTGWIKWIEMKVQFSELLNELIHQMLNLLKQEDAKCWLEVVLRLLLAVLPPNYLINNSWEAETETDNFKIETKSRWHAIKKNWSTIIVAMLRETHEQSSREQQVIITNNNNNNNNNLIIDITIITNFNNNLTTYISIIIIIIIIIIITNNNIILAVTPLAPKTPNPPWKLF